jgi:cytochrome c peroxidase
VRKHRKVNFAIITVMAFLLQILGTSPLVGIANAQPTLNPEAVRNFAASKGLKSLRVAIQEDYDAGKGLPLLLNPELERSVPLPEDLNDFVRDRVAAAQLGKALFFEMAIGSDGQGCVSCHFHAGADNRVQNQLSPDFTRIANKRDGDIKGFHEALPRRDFEFQEPEPIDGGWGPNYTLLAEDFPFVKNIGDGDNVVDLGDDTIGPAADNTNDVASSQGVFFTDFVSVDLNRYNPAALTLPDIRDDGMPVSDDSATSFGGFFGANFQVLADGGAFDSKVNVRRVEPRNTPTNINAVFNFHNFWDGRANNRFNGVNPFGNTDPNDPKIWKKGKKGVVEPYTLEMKNASLASQAVGPPLSEFEMSFFGRSFPDIARKMLDLHPLINQEVDANDSLLGPLQNSDDPDGGLTMTYRELIHQAFVPEFWDATALAPVSAAVTNVAPNVTIQALNVTANGGIPLDEANFSFFWGISIMLYQAELVADDTPVDRFMAGNNSALNQDELLGLAVFVGYDDGSGIKDGRCINCHGGPETTNASVRNTQGPEGVNLIEPMFMGNGLPGFYDNGFYNIAVTPTAEDVGRGGKGPGGHPLSSSRQFLFEAVLDPSIDIPFEIIGLPLRGLEKRPGVMGPKKGAELGVIEIHPVTGVETFIPVCVDTNGDNRCDQNDDILLERVNVDGNFKTPTIRSIEFTGPYLHNGSAKTLLEVVEFYDRGGNFCRLNFPDLDPDIEFIGLNRDEEEGLVKFMIALTDERVRYREAPFDHPEYIISNGHPGNQDLTESDDDFENKQAVDEVHTIDAVGATGDSDNQLKAWFLWTHGG